MNDIELAEHIVELLDGRTIATAESCTAGRVTQALASVPKAAEFLRGGLVAYQDEPKQWLLGVTADSVLTSVAAQQMAAGAAKLLQADVTVATTGVAGHEPEDGTPPGTVYIATSIDGRVTSATHQFDGEPSAVCDQATSQALRDLLARLSNMARPPWDQPREVHPGNQVLVAKPQEPCPVDGSHVADSQNARDQTARSA
jgi:nicotinamide-nucleotide amidase